MKHVVWLLLILLIAGCTASSYSKEATQEAIQDDWVEKQLDQYTRKETPAPAPVGSFVVYGNPDSMIYHHPPNHPKAQRPCKVLSPSKAIRFNSPAEARAAGYRPCQTRGCNLP